jgi:hypothetical protein
MSIKNKNPKSTADQLNTAAMQAGLLLMTVATTLGMVELPDRTNRIIVPNQPAFAMVTSSHFGEPPTTPIRSEREETAPHYITYSTVQRTPSRTGRL